MQDERDAQMSGLVKSFIYYITIGQLRDNYLVPDIWIEKQWCVTFISLIGRYVFRSLFFSITGVNWNILLPRISDESPIVSRY